MVRTNIKLSFVHLFLPRPHIHTCTLLTVACQVLNIDCCNSFWYYCFDLRGDTKVRNHLKLKFSLPFQLFQSPSFFDKNMHKMNCNLKKSFNVSKHKEWLPSFASRKSNSWINLHTNFSKFLWNLSLTIKIFWPQVRP